MNEICAYFTSKSFTDELRLLQEGYSSAFAFFEKKKTWGKNFHLGHLYRFQTPFGQKMRFIISLKRTFQIRVPWPSALYRFDCISIILNFAIENNNFDIYPTSGNFWQNEIFFHALFSMNPTPFLSEPSCICRKKITSQLQYWANLTGYLQIVYCKELVDSFKEVFDFPFCRREKVLVEKVSLPRPLRISPSIRWPAPISI